RRMSQLEEMGLLKSYISKATKEKVYYQDKKISDHRLYCYDFIKEIVKLGAEVTEYKIEPRYLDGAIIPDAFIIFKHEGYKYYILLEVDYTHYTSNIKFNTLYEKLYEERVNYSEFNNTFPIVLVARPTEGIRYNSSNFECVFTDLSYNKVQQLILS
ncbi:MAG: hypothetical protein ACRC68_16805, partial [Clostridium sp.]